MVRNDTGQMNGKCGCVVSVGVVKRMNLSNQIAIHLKIRIYSLHEDIDLMMKVFILLKSIKNKDVNYIHHGGTLLIEINIDEKKKKNT